MRSTGIALVCLLALGACAQVPASSKVAQPVQPVARTVVAQAGAAARTAAVASDDAAGEAAREVPLPNEQLTSDILYRLLLAEVALQRGQPGVAVQGYLDLARMTKDPRIAQRATEVAWNARSLTAAREAARIWLAADPESSQAQQVLVALLISDSRLTEAEPMLARSFAEDPQNVGANFLRLNGLLSRATDKTAVVGMIQRLAAPYKDMPEAHYAIARAAMIANDNALALDEIKIVLTMRPDWEQAAIFMEQLLQKTSVASALDFAQGYLKNHPKAPDLRLNYARLLVTDKNYPQARAEFETLAREYPDNPDVTMAIGLLSLQMNDYDRAHAEFIRALDLNYKDPDAIRFYLGQLDEERNNTDDALKWYGSINGGEQYVASRVRYAALLAKNGKLDDARKYLHDSTRNAQQYVQFTQAEAQLLRDASDYSGAYQVLSQAVEKNPNSPELLYDEAMAAEKVDRIDVFEANLRKVIALDPDHAHAYNALGYTFADRNMRLPEAYTLIEHALKLAPDDPFIMDSMGWVLYRMGRTDAAVTYLKRAFEIRPDAEIAAHLGEVLWTTDRRDEAHKVWNTALKSDPGNEALLTTVKKFAAQ
jgi:tetratricopeptide (TPR) repeat protein